MKRAVVRLAALGCLALFTAAPAGADQGATFLLGMYSPSAPHPAVGFSWRLGGPRASLEMEYAGTPGRPTGRTPRAASATLNLLVRTPLQLHGARLHAIAGVGLYGESSADSGSGELSPIVLGVGTTLPLSGWTGLRIEYRAYVVQREPGDPRLGRMVPQRLSIGFTFGL
jgi:hypothetical protein